MQMLILLSTSWGNWWYWPDTNDVKGKEWVMGECDHLEGKQFYALLAISMECLHCCSLLLMAVPHSSTTSLPQEWRHCTSQTQMHPIAAEAEPGGKCLQDQIFLVMLCLVLHNTGLAECVDFFQTVCHVITAQRLSKEQVCKSYKIKLWYMRQ